MSSEEFIPSSSGTCTHPPQNEETNITRSSPLAGGNFDYVEEEDSGGSIAVYLPRTNASLEEVARIEAKYYP